MGKILAAVFQTIRRNLFLFLFIVLILASGKTIRNEWIQLQRIVNELPELRSSDSKVSEHQQEQKGRIAQQLAKMSEATEQQLAEEIGVLDNEISLLKRDQKSVSLTSAAMNGSGQMIQALQQQTIRSIDLELRLQAKAYITLLHTHVVVLNKRRAALQRLEQLRVTHVKVYGELQNSIRQLGKLEADAGMLAKIPFTKSYKQIEKLREEVRGLKGENNRLYRDYLAQRTVIEHLSLPAALSDFRLNEQRLADAVAPLRLRLIQAESLAANNFLWLGYQALQPLLATALAVLIGWWLVPAVIRLFFYFVLAPLAARRPAMVIGAITGTAHISHAIHQHPMHDKSLSSAVSRMSNLVPGDEMLIRPDYCQSQPVGVSVTTKFLFNWHKLFTSIAAHLWMLKRLRVTVPAAIVVSSTSDALEEIAFLEIAAGEVIVLQPRGLVGMVYKTGQSPRIRSHWRLGTLHAWLTLQLRYLSFEGPATLIIKGCRGVRLENASSGRTISQEATLGFSANAAYSTVRAEPFVPYLLGKQPLFQDKFHGPDAYYLYEEVPRNARPGAPNSNPLEVLFDACLKAFGI